MDSVWSATLASFRDKVTGTDPVPAGVSAAAVSAALALALVSKVLAITARRKDFRGDRARVDRLLADVLRQSKILEACADRDIVAFREGNATEVPMTAARAVVAGLDLCVEAAGIAYSSVAADLGSAAELLLGAAAVMLFSVSPQDVLPECEELKAHARTQREEVLRRITRDPAH